MPDTPFDDQADALKKRAAKYIAPVILGFLCCVLVGQLISMMVPLSALNKASGRITSIDTVILSYTHHRYSATTADYGPVIRLDNKQSFPIEEIDAQASLGAVLKKGDYVTIYYPTPALRIVSATLVRDVCQVERGGVVLYSWKGQQNDNWYVIVFLVVAIGFFYGMMVYIRNFLNARKIK